MRFMLDEDPTPPLRERTQEERDLDAAFSRSIYADPTAFVFAGRTPNQAAVLRSQIKEAYSAGYRAARAEDQARAAVAAARPRKFKRVEREIRNIRWRRVHNLVAHPFLEIFRPWGLRLHAYTAEKMYQGSPDVVIEEDEIQG